MFVCEQRKCGWFADDETTEGVTTITPEDVLNAGNDGYVIKTSGVYNLEGGTYTGGYIFISYLAEDVTINLQGDITVLKTAPANDGNPGALGAFILVKKCSLTINGEGHTVEAGGNGHPVEAGKDFNLIVSRNGAYLYTSRRNI